MAASGDPKEKVVKNIKYKLNDFNQVKVTRLKFIYSEKATKFCEISTVDLTDTT